MPIRIWLIFIFIFYIYYNKYMIYSMNAAPLYLDFYNT